MQTNKLSYAGAGSEIYSRGITTSTGRWIKWCSLNVTDIAPPYLQLLHCLIWGGDIGKWHNLLLSPKLEHISNTGHICIELSWQVWRYTTFLRSGRPRPLAFTTDIHVCNVRWLYSVYMYNFYKTFIDRVIIYLSLRVSLRWIAMPIGPCCKLCGDGTFWKYDMYSNFNILAKVTKLLSLVTAI